MCFHLGKAECQEIFPIRFFNGGELYRFNEDFTNEQPMTEEELQDLAYRDGFENATAMVQWFWKTYNMDMFYFYFAVIRW